MKKIFYIGLMSIGLVACSTVSTAPLDDAYYWEKSQPAQSTQIIQSTQSSPAPAPKQTVEFTNVQDTTVTIRIHK
jgi:uncharacterized protein YcfL